MSLTSRRTRRLTRSKPRATTDPTLSRKNHDWWNKQATEFLVCSCGFVVIAEIAEYVEHRKKASQDDSDGKFGDALADALASAEDDEQAEGLARVLEDCIGGETEDEDYFLR